VAPWKENVKIANLHLRNLVEPDPGEVDGLGGEEKWR